MPNLIQKSENVVSWNGTDFECRIGANGFSKNKVEGDKKTPTGSFSFLHLYYRSDFLKKPQTVLPLSEITAEMGWSDDVADEKYNKLVKLPYNFSHEKMFRNDRIYDLVIVNSHNQNPTVAGLGSAVFIHLMNECKTPTHGCLALNIENLLQVIKEADTNTKWIVGDNLA